MSTFVDFVPSTVAAFSFQATTAGQQYNVTITWNVFGQRYYYNVTDLAGNLILCRGLAASGPILSAVFTWGNGVATATTQAAHNVPVGSLASVNMSQTNSGFDGDVQSLATGPNTLTYALLTDPGVEPTAGVVNFSLNLVAGYIPGGWLLFHLETQQFEFG